MYNFIIRPIKSYATIDITALDGQVIKRGEYVELSMIDAYGTVNGKHMGRDDVSFSMSAFTHSFTANALDINKARAEEAKWFAPKKSDK